MGPESGERGAGRRQEEPPGEEGPALGARLRGAGRGAMAAGRARRLLGSLWLALLLGQPQPSAAAARSGPRSPLTGTGSGGGSAGRRRGAVGAERPAPGCFYSPFYDLMCIFVRVWLLFF